MRLQKKKGGRNGVVLRRHCFFFFFPWTCSRGRKSFVFFPLALPPHVLYTTKTGRHLHLFMMRKQRSRALQATPPLATSAGAAAVQETCAPCMGSDGMGQGRPRSPCPYKYHPNAREKKEKKNGSKRGEKPKERETDQEREKPIETVETKKKQGISTGRLRETVGEKEEKG